MTGELPELTPQQHHAATIRGRDVVVTAGAGSGKTRTLVARYMSLLDEGCPPRQILAITFTEKAAREMRNRVRRAVRARVEAAATPEERAPWSALEGVMDAARIGTIHSFCAEVLRAFPAQAGVDPEFVVVEEGTAAMLRRQVVDQAPAWTVQSPDVVPLFASFAPERLREVLSFLLQRRLDAQAAIAPNGGDGDHWHQALRLYLRTWVDAPEVTGPIADLRRLAEDGDLRQDAGDKLTDQVSGLLADWQAMLASLASDDLLGAASLLFAIRRSRMGLQAGRKSSQAKACLATLRDSYRERIAPWLGGESAQDNAPDASLEAAMVGDLPRLAALFRQTEDAYRQSLDERFALDFDDLEQKALDLLQIPEVRLRWQAELAAILVDEFQDTNTRQRDIVDALSGGSSGRVLVVGDARQSIYRFRGADVTVFRRMGESITARGGEPIELELTFRAHDALLRALDPLLAPVMGHGEDPDRPYAVPYTRMTAHRSEPHCGVESPFVEFVLGVGGNAEAARPHAARALVRRLIELSQEGQLASWEDVALLFRASTGFGAYEDALEAAGVPFVTVAGRGFYDRPEIRDVLNMLQALATPWDDLALAGLLRSPAFGLSDVALYRLRSGVGMLRSIWSALQGDLGVLDPPDRAAAASALRCPRCGEPLKLSGPEGGSGPEVAGSSRSGNSVTRAGPNGRDGARPERADRVMFESIGKAGDPEDVIAFSVMPVRGVPRDVAAIEQLINAVGAAAGPISLDIAADEGRRYLIVRCRRRAAEFVQAQITSIYGSPIFERLDPGDDPAIRMERCGGLVATGRMRLHAAPHLPLLTWRELQENDPVLGLMGAAGSVREGELALSQVLIHGRASEGWARPYLRELLRLKRRGFGIVRAVDVMRLLALLAGLAGLSYVILAGTVSGAWFSVGRLATLVVSAASLYVGGPLIAGRAHGAEWDESIEALVETKIQRPAYRCEVRLAVAASTRDRAVQLLEQMAAAYNLFSQDSGNQLELLAPARSPQFTPASLAAYEPAVSLLNAAEIAGMWHMPLAELPDLLSASRVQVALPIPEQVLDPAGLLIGEARKSSGVRVPVYLPPEALKRHMLLVGRTRMGKTTLAQHVACWAMRQPGRALVIVDPHRDMVDELLGHVPPERVGDVVLIDLADEEFLPGFNVLDVQQVGDAEKVVEAFVDVSYILWAGYWGPRMVVPLRMLLLALALANTRRAPEQQFTILALAPLIALTRERRSHFLREVLPLDDPQSHNVIAYFETEYDDLTPSFQERVVSPVLSKARAFEFNSRIRAMVGQPASTINPWRFVADGKIVLFHTARPTVGDEFASFMGSVVLNYVRRAILAQGAVPVEERVPATVIVDESQTMAAVDYASIMAEAQKFGGSILLSTQGLSLLEPSVQRENLARVALDRQLLANTDTLMVFRVAGDDASRISVREFGEEVPPATLTNLPQFNAYVRTVVGREVVPPFAVETRPMPKADASIRTEVLAARSAYSLPYAEATAAAHRAMNVILQHFGTEVAAATAIHDGAFGDLLGRQLDFPPLPVDLSTGPAAPQTGAREMPSDADHTESHQEKGKQERVRDTNEASARSPGGKSPRDRMVDMLDRIAGWIDMEPDREEEDSGNDAASA